LPHPFSGILAAGNGPHLMGFYGTISISCLLWHEQTAGSIPPAYAWTGVTQGLAEFLFDMASFGVLVHELPPHRWQKGLSGQIFTHMSPS